jgi:hypothetical protein
VEFGERKDIQRKKAMRLDSSRIPFFKEIPSGHNECLQSAVVYVVIRTAFS